MCLFVNLTFDFFRKKYVTSPYSQTALEGERDRASEQLFKLEKHIAMS